MSCRRYGPLISQLIDGELTPTERVRVLDHVRECAACADLLASYRRIRSDLRQLDPLEPPPTLAAAVRQHTLPPPARRVTWLGVARISTVATVTAAMVLLVLLPVLGQGGVSSSVAARLADLLAPAVTVVPSPTPPLTVQSVDTVPTATATTPPLPTASPTTVLGPTATPARPTATALPPTATPARSLPMTSVGQPPAVTADESGPAHTAATPTAAERAAVAATSPPRQAAASAPTSTAPTKPAASAPTPTPRPATATPTRQPTVAPTPTRAPSPTPSSAPMVADVFTAAYLEPTGVRARLGVPVAEATAIDALAQPFERGRMEWIATGRQVYVLYQDGQTWASFADTWNPDETLPPGEEPPPDRQQPVRIFGKIWRDNPAVRERLGWAMAKEQRFRGIVQRFERGLMLLDIPAGAVYVLYEDGAWQRFTQQ